MTIKNLNYQKNTIVFLDNPSKIQEIACNAIFINLNTTYLDDCKFCIRDFNLSDYYCVAVNSKSKKI